MPVNNFVVFCSVCKDTLDCSLQLITKACHEMSYVSCYGVACNVIFLLQSEMDQSQVTGQFNLHDLIIRVYITILLRKLFKRRVIANPCFLLALIEVN
jgi:hypothetical protein